MSIDFDSAALQTQHDEEEYDQEDYAREQELHKLLTDLPDDMLEDSIDSSPELEYSTCSNKNTGSSPQSAWTPQWSDHPRPPSHEQDCEVDEEYAYEDGAVQNNGHHPLPNTWNQDHQYTQGDYTYTSMGSEKPTETKDCSTDEYESKPYLLQLYCFCLQTLQPGVLDRVDQHHATYNPHHPAHQPAMFNSQAVQQEGQFDHLQREFLDSTQQTADRELLAQLQILHTAQQRQIEDLERKLEDSRRNMRYIEHQFAIAKDEKDGLAVSLKESSQLVEEAKDREVQMQNKVKAMEQQVQVLTERDQENSKKQRVAEAAVDSMKQQMLELCRSDTLSRTRQQHDRDLAVIKEQHENALLTLQQELDSTSQTLNEKIDVGQRLREQVKKLERQREEEQLERARVVNTLTQRLEESQQQCAQLLQTGSVQEMSQIQIKLQKAQSAKALSENMNTVLQDLSELKEQITLYESAVKHGVIALDLNSEWENHLSDSCVDLGLKKTNRKNGFLHSTALAHLSDSKLPRDEALRLLRLEMQRCLGSLKGKRQKISQLQEELLLCQGRLTALQTQLDEAKLCSSVRETSRMKHGDVTGESQKEFARLQEDKQHLQDQNMELKQSEEKLRSANLELCTKMREMIQELDQEKQEAAQRAERINQQYRDDVVDRVRTELMLEHDAQVEQLTAHHQQQVQQFQTKLSEANDKMLAVQECYISVCKEKDTIDKEEAVIRVNEVYNPKFSLEYQKQENRKETAEATCQADAIDASSMTITVEELDSRLSAQKQQLQLDSDKVKCKAVEEARKQTQREQHEKHLENMAKQVEGAVTRAYNRWIEDLTLLPEYQASLQTEREKWEELQEKCTEQQVSQALKVAEEQWYNKHKNQLEEQSSGTQRVKDLQEEVASLHSQLEQERREQAALLKAELAGARAAWNRDNKEISVIQVRSEQVYQSKLQEQRKKLELALQQLLLQDPKTDQQGTEDTKRTSGATSEGTITHIIKAICTDLVNRAVSQAKKEWKKVNEEKLSRVLKETQEQHEREMDKMQSM
uniref:Centrosomal protein 152 n=1 Tax=Cyclopterus lumpus TaxID=8103 RepID=A0A8C3G0G9_CYCLU